MERPANTILRIGAWRVDPASGQMSLDGETARLEARTMRLLLCLADRAGEVVSIDDLLNNVWPDVIVTQDSVYQAVASLRRLLRDDAKQPVYIATVPRLGYRLVANVSPWDELAEVHEGSLSTDDRHDPPLATPATSGPRQRLRYGLLVAVGAALCLALVAGFVLRQRSVNHRLAATATAIVQPPKSVAVLPILDLTEGMHQETFADGMTEELIDRLSKIPGLLVPPPTSSFFFKDKQVPVADIARTLGVAYLLDGSVRKSGDRLRVSARLIRADSGFVVWTETYDRPFHDILMVQDDIAGEVAKALRASTEFKTPQALP